MPCLHDCGFSASQALPGSCLQIRLPLALNDHLSGLHVPLITQLSTTHTVTLSLLNKSHPLTNTYVRHILCLRPANTAGNQALDVHASMLKTFIDNLIIQV